jgi:NAD(P)-dependent dehydrogenase (short-subunit alcohol dehydrogenase family)
VTIDSNNAPSNDAPSNGNPTGDLFGVARLDWLAPGGLFRLAGKVALVTGAAGGIGRWFAAGLAAAGARVMLTDRAAAELETVADALAKQGWPVAVLAVDLQDDDSAERIVRGAVERFGRLDIVLDNAGINQRLPMVDVPKEVLEHHWKIDYIRCYELAQAAARVMIERGEGGSIIHTSSLNNAFGLEDVSLVGPAKAALSQLTKGMAIELARFGIRTNAIAPGFMATPMNSTHWTHETRAPWILDRTPLCRPGHPSELVGACLLLASEAGSFITGQTLYVDGGFTAGSRWNVPPGTGPEVYRDRGGYCSPPISHETARERPTDPEA